VKARTLQSKYGAYLSGKTVRCDPELLIAAVDTKRHPSSSDCRTPEAFIAAKLQSGDVGFVLVTAALIVLAASHSSSSIILGQMKYAN
jgi:hypothetical protein